MKRIVSLLVCIVLMLSVCITANAAGGATLNGNTSVTVGSNIEFTVNVSGCGDDATSIAVDISHSDKFELVSGSWLKTGSLAKFDTSTKKGALGGLTSHDVNGNLFKVVLKAKTADPAAQNVSVNVIARNGSDDIMNVTPSKSVKINCATHSFGAFTKKDATNHTRTCSACGYVETKAHTWNSGSVTKTANCKETGTKTFTCTACNATKTQTIAKTNNHTYGSWSQTKAPSCTAKGQEKRTCSTCQKVETRDINATGHSFGSWTQTKAPTCEGKGEQTRSCSKCSHKETKAVNALGHKFSNPTVTKAPTCTQTGIETGKCTVCKKETTNTIKALGHKFGEWTVKTAATCTEKGIEEHKCSVCEATENRDIEALGHDFEDPKTIKEPTISETGLKQGKCKICGQITEEVIPCTAKDETTGVIIETDKGVFQEGTELKVEEIKKENKENKEKHKEIKKVLKEVSEKFVAYDITTVLNGAKVQPNGKIKVTFKIPEGFSNILKVFFIGDDGTTQEQTSKVNEDGTITAELSHFSTYVICDMNEDSVIGTNGNAQSNTLLIIIPIAAVVVIGAVVIIIVATKKKKAKVEE